MTDGLNPAATFDARRRVGPMSAPELTALRPFLRAHPRPVSLIHVLDVYESIPSFTHGMFLLQDRGWLRVRRHHVSISRRCMPELLAIAPHAAKELAC